MGEFNKIFKLLRQTRGYSQADLSEVLEISRSSVSVCMKMGIEEPDSRL